MNSGKPYERTGSSDITSRLVAQTTEGTGLTPAGRPPGVSDGVQQEHQPLQPRVRRGVELRPRSARWRFITDGPASLTSAGRGTFESLVRLNVLLVCRHTDGDRVGSADELEPD